MSRGISEKEKQFASEYVALLEKYNVRLIVETSRDEYGSYAKPIFKESGAYCSISYEPDHIKTERGYRGMGG